MPRLSLAFAAASLLPAWAFAAESKVDFNFDIAPLLSSKCYHCHGPDEKAREAKLRLDVRDEALQERDGVRAIIPGDPGKSELIIRLASKDRDEVMPPPKEEHPLSAQEIDLFRRWIAEGAEYKPHWSFVKPTRPTPPEVPDAKAKIRNPIDAFIVARLAGTGLSQSPEADRATLIRRLSLDLIGLPPTLAETDAFLADQSADALEKLVDRLLASPALGERWARMWLDLARYADSTGYGSDKFRLNVWPWRDWVIGALNRNVSYDQFSIEMLAGDLLPNAAKEQIIATGFHRNTQTNVEGGTNDEEWRVAAVKDRIATTGQVWMGLTVGCAQCHTHKFDPITHEDYYRFFGVFNQTEDSDREDEEPKLPLPTPEEATKLETLRSEIAKLEARMKETTPELEAELVAWEAARAAKPVMWETLRPLSVRGAAKTFGELDEQNVVTIAGLTPPTDYTTIRIAGPLPTLTALRLEGVPNADGKKHGGRSEHGRFVISEVRATIEPAEPMTPPGEQPPPANNKARVVALHDASADFEGGNNRASQALDGSAETGWGTVGSPDGEHALVMRVKTPVEVLAGEELVITLNQKQRDHTLGRFRMQATSDSTPARELPPGIKTTLALSLEQRSAAQRTALRDYFRPLSQEYGPIDRELGAKRAALATIKPIAQPVMRELAADKRRATHILTKGNYLAPGAKVEPGLLSHFAPSAETPTDRLVAARWLVSAENPLTARVAVNRYWARLFGTGLVETEEDFGSQGALPSHPELLDWLAVAFMSPTAGTPSPALETSALPTEFALGWDVKALLRLIVTSATYRQSSKITPQMIEKDARNRLLARAPRLRLDAETVRDQALAVSGLLSTKMGGPSVYPPQPDGLWKVAFNGGQNAYPTSKGEDRYRRGLYTFWRRTMPPPNMTTFDAPSRESCTLRRQPTNTPLQAFVTMNDPVFVECSQALARRLVREGGADTDARLRFGLRLVSARPPTDEQVRALAQLHAAELAEYRADSAAATKLAPTIAPHEDPADLAAWTVVANVLLNLDTVLTRP